jgi:hypothetical protein
MSYTFTLYGLGVAADSPIPGVPSAPIASVDLHLFMGKLPDWLSEVTSDQLETWYISEYKHVSGEPSLRVFLLAGGKRFWFRYTDGTEFLIDNDAANLWAVWPEELTIEDTATYLLGPIMGFVLLLRVGGGCRDARRPRRLFPYSACLSVHSPLAGIG